MQDVTFTWYYTMLYKNVFKLIYLHCLNITLKNSVKLVYIAHISHSVVDISHGRVMSSILLYSDKHCVSVDIRYCTYCYLSVLLP